MEQHWANVFPLPQDGRLPAESLILPRRLAKTGSGPKGMEAGRGSFMGNRRSST
jgi:hypothetical protein